MNTNYISYHKLVIFGDKGSGKSSLVRRLDKHDFIPNMKPSNFVTTSKICLLEDEHPPIYLNIYEMQIDEEYNLINKKIIFNAQCIIYLFDLTKDDSYEKIKNLVKLIESIDKHSKIKKILVGNKLDDEENRSVAGYEAKSFIDDYPSFIQYLDVSMQTAEGIDELIQSIFESFKTKENEENFNTKGYELKEWILSTIPQYNNSTGVYKIIILGDSLVGKTALINRIVSKDFDPNLKKSVGIKDDCKYILIGNKEIKVHLFDTAGMEKFKSLPKKYFQQADGVILLFDVTREDSLKATEQWFKDVNEFSKKDVVVYLVGNKIDLINDRHIEQDNANSLAFLQGIKYSEISCKFDINVHETVNAVIWDIYANSMSTNNMAYSCDSIGLIKSIDDDSKGKCCSKDN